MKTKSEIICRYIQLRSRWRILFPLLGLVIILLLSIFWRCGIIVFVGLVFFINLLEIFFIKCPLCKKRICKIWCQFPEKCSHCGKKFSTE